MKTISSELAPGQTGLGFRGRTTVLSRVPPDSKAVRNAPAGNPITEFKAILANPDADAAMQQLKARRDDESHLRVAGSLELPGAAESALMDLTTLYHAASFLADLPLIHVTAFHWDTFQRLGTVSYRELTGDHPVVPTRTIIHGDPEIEVGSLYVIDGQNRMHLFARS